MFLTKIKKLLALVVIFLTACSDHTDAAYSHNIDRVPIIISIKSPRLDANEIALLKKYKPFGVLLFGENCINESQVIELIKQLKSLGLKVAIDLEGKLINRFRKFYPLDKDPADFTGASLQDIYDYYSKIAKYAKKLGIDIIFGPVTDICDDPQKGFLYKRCFQGDVKRVSECAYTVIKAYQDAGIFPVIKHLPGHGKAVDSHQQLPTVAASFDELSAHDIAVSKAVVQKLQADGRPLPGGMVSHVVYEQIDPNNPATFSRKIIQDVVRNDIGLKDGIIFSDSMAMIAVIVFLIRQDLANGIIPEALNKLLKVVEDGTTQQELVTAINNNDVIVLRKFLHVDNKDTIKRQKLIAAISDYNLIELNKFLEAGGNIAIFDYSIEELAEAPEIFNRD